MALSIPHFLRSTNQITSRGKRGFQLFFAQVCQTKAKSLEWLTTDFASAIEREMLLHRQVFAVFLAEVYKVLFGKSLTVQVTPFALVKSVRMSKANLKAHLPSTSLHRYSKIPRSVKHWSMEIVRAGRFAKVLP